MQVAAHPLPLQGGFQVLHVVRYFGADEGICGGGGEAFELAKLRRRRRRGGHKHLRQFLADNLRGAFLVAGVDVGEQETNRDGLHARRFQLSGGLANLVLMERDEDLAMRRDATLADDFAMPTLHQHTILPGDLLPDGIILRSLMPADVDDVPIAPGDHHAGDGAIVLQNGVGGEGCAM
jgi:hypothetical protein